MKLAVNLALLGRCTTLSRDTGIRALDFRLSSGCTLVIGENGAATSVDGHPRGQVLGQSFVSVLTALRARPLTDLSLIGSGWW